MFDGLSISISGSGKQAQSAVRGVREALQDTKQAAVGMAGGLNVAGESMDETASDAAGLSLAMRGLRGQTDEAGDEMMETAGKMATASAAISAAGGAAGSTNFSFMGLSTTTSLSLIPSLLALSTTLAPLAAAFVTVAAGATAVGGAFATLIGAGLLAWGEQLAGQMQGVSSATEALSKVAGQLKSRLADVIAPLGQTFVPLLQDAALALPVVVEEMVRAVGSTEEFRETLRGFGMVAARVLPAVTGFMFDFARDALPPTRRFLNFLLANGPSAFRDMRASAAELKPELMAFLDALIRGAPVLLEFGTNVADLVIPALTTLIEVGTSVMQFVNNLPGPLRDAAIATAVLAPAITGLAGTASSLAGVLGGTGGVLSLLGGSGGLATALTALTGPVGIAIAAVGLLAGAWATNMGGIQDKTRATVRFVRNQWNGLLNEIGEKSQFAEGIFRGLGETAGKATGLGTATDTLFGKQESGGDGAASTDGESAAESTSNAYLKRLKKLQSKDFSESFLSPENFRVQGEQAGAAAAQGLRSGLSGVTIRSDGLTPTIRKALKSGVQGYKSSGLEDKATKINESLFDAVARTDKGASASTLGVSQQEFQVLMSRYAGGGGGGGSVTGLAAPGGRSGSSGMPSTGLNSLKPIVGKFETAVDKFARVMNDGFTVRVRADDEWIDAKLERRDERQNREYQARRGGPRPTQ